MLFVMAILTKIFQVVHVKGHAWVVDILRRDVILVVDNHTGTIKPGGSAPLTQSIGPFNNCLSGSLPCR